MRGRGAGVREKRRAVSHRQGGARAALRRHTAGRVALDWPARGRADVRVRVRSVAAQSVPIGHEEQARHAQTGRVLLWHAAW
jgi:hypothetical protein